jgi:hypothetical protein
MLENAYKHIFKRIILIPFRPHITTKIPPKIPPQNLQKSSSNEITSRVAYNLATKIPHHFTQYLNALIYY